MITGLGGSTIWSSDVNNLLPFYRDIVGLTPGVTAPGFALFGDQAAPALAVGTHSEVRGRASDPYRHIVGLNSTDIHGDTARLKAAGVEFIEDPNDQGDGFFLATFVDPEGNLIQLYQFPG
ncbi:MAG: VOC family protein [Chloroflexi bacterium]|nr:VOC family protein [Chloroflexota bacterium]